MTEEKTNLPDPMKTFQERVLNKVRTDIADMLPEEAIKSMFDKALEDVFFKEIPEVRDQWGHLKQGAKRSWFAEEVCRQAEPLVKEYVAKHMEQFLPQLDQTVKDFLKAENLMMIAVGTMTQVSNQQMTNNLGALAQQIAMHIRQGY